MSETEPYELAADEIIEMGIRTSSAVPFINGKNKLMEGIIPILKRHFRFSGEACTPAPNIREEVQIWAARMEARLRRYDSRRGRTGWLERDPKETFLHLVRKIGLLAEALEGAAPDKTAEDMAADISNLASMITDTIQFQRTGRKP